MTNTLAYYNKDVITIVKCLIINALGDCTIKHFTVITVAVS